MKNSGGEEAWSIDGGSDSEPEVDEIETSLKMKEVFVEENKINSKGNSKIVRKNIKAVKTKDACELRKLGREIDVSVSKPETRRKARTIYQKPILSSSLEYQEEPSYSSLLKRTVRGQQKRVENKITDKNKRCIT